MISIQTNVTSLMAQQNLNTDNAFQSKTIQQLTSGYRINSSGDDAAGLAIANGYRSSVAELTQGVANANDGTSQMQIIDGGLSNISTILDRMKTLATQSASGTFTGSRATLNQEYAGLQTEINRQAANINLNADGANNTNLNVYIGGAGATQSNASININLSGAANAVDATSLGIASTNVLGGGVGVTGNTQRLDAPGGAFVKGTAGVDDQTFTFNVFSGGNAQTVTATVAASTTGSSLTSVLSSLNGQLNQYGISAGTDNNGALQFSGASAFTVADNSSLSGAGTNLLTNETAMIGKTVYTPTAQVLTLTNTAGTVSTVNLLVGDTMAQAMTKINAQTSSTGISAVTNAAGTGINLVGAGAFQATQTNTGLFTVTGAQTGYTAGTGVILGQTTSTASTAGDTLAFTNAAGKTLTVTLAADATSAALITDINTKLTAGGLTGVTAVANSAGTGVNFVGSGAFGVVATESNSTGVFTATVTTTATVGSATSENTANNTIDGAATFHTLASALNQETMHFQTSAGSAAVTINAGDTLAATIANINAHTAGLGVNAVLNGTGTGISLQGANSFSVNDAITVIATGAAVASTAGVFAAPAGIGDTTNVTSTAPPAGSAATSNGTAAITAIDTAIANLGLVQGSVGAGENKLQYASNLAQSQISSYSAAESQIRDADVAAQAANLTKAQVLIQTSVAALAQANSAPQSILKLLQ
jgi:flagellin